MAEAILVGVVYINPENIELENTNVVKHPTKINGVTYRTSDFPCFVKFNSTEGDFVNNKDYDKNVQQCSTMFNT